MAQRELHRARGFGANAGEYDRLRSGPPAQAVAWLVKPGDNAALELGAGTGLFSREIIQRVDRLYAVEPDHRMRGILESQCPAVTAFPGSAEEIPLPDNSVDAVYAADCWHWFDPEKASREIARVLRPGGTLGVLWNRKDRTVTWMNTLFAVLDGAHNPNRLPGSFVIPPYVPFGTPERHVVKWSRPMSPEDLVALLGTYSMVLAMPEDERAELYENSLEYINGHPELAGRPVIQARFETVCWRTRLEA